MKKYVQPPFGETPLETPAIPMTLKIRLWVKVLVNTARIFFDEHWSFNLKIKKIQSGNLLAGKSFQPVRQVLLISGFIWIELLALGIMQRGHINCSFLWSLNDRFLFGFGGRTGKKSFGSMPIFSTFDRVVFTDSYLCFQYFKGYLLGWLSAEMIFSASKGCWVAALLDKALFAYWVWYSWKFYTQVSTIFYSFLDLLFFFNQEPFGSHLSLSRTHSTHQNL